MSLHGKVAIVTGGNSGIGKAIVLALAQAGANLEYIYTRRLADKPGAGILYVAPISGASAVKAARSAGLHEVDTPLVALQKRFGVDRLKGLEHLLRVAVVHS